jgi:lysophospholipase L1-like esterase
MSTMLVGCAAATPAPSTEAPVYLALGDSVAFGYSPLVDREVGVSGYPEALAAKLGMPDTNAACPGEASGGFVDPNGSDNGCRDNRTQYPLHASYTGTQLAFAIDFLRAHPETKLVTIDLGANDAMILKHGCADSTTCILAGFVGMLGSYEHNMDFIFGELRKVYAGDLVALQIYDPNPTDSLSQYGVERIDTVLADVAAQHGAIVVDGRAAFASTDPCGAGLLIALPAGGCDIHPTARGHTLLADAIAAAL